jgi:hypothetical protein
VLERVTYGDLVPIYLIVPQHVLGQSFERFSGENLVDERPMFITVEDEDTMVLIDTEFENTRFIGRRRKD